MYILGNRDFLPSPQLTGEKENRLFLPDDKLIDHERDSFSVPMRQGITHLYIYKIDSTTDRNSNHERLASNAYRANKQKNLRAIIRTFK